MSDVHVYQSQGKEGGPIPPPPKKKPILFCYETVEKTPLSLEEELRLMMKKMRAEKKTREEKKSWKTSFLKLFQTQKKAPPKKAHTKAHSLGKKPPSLDHTHKTPVPTLGPIQKQGLQTRQKISPKNVRNLKTPRAHPPRRQSSDQTIPRKLTQALQRLQKFIQTKAHHLYRTLTKPMRYGLEIVQKSLQKIQHKVYEPVASQGKSLYKKGKKRIQHLQEKISASNQHIDQQIQGFQEQLQHWIHAHIFSPLLRFSKPWILRAKRWKKQKTHTHTLWKKRLKSWLFLHAQKHVSPRLYASYRVIEKGVLSLFAFLTLLLGILLHSTRYIFYALKSALWIFCKNLIFGLWIVKNFSQQIFQHFVLERLLRSKLFGIGIQRTSGKKPIDLLRMK